MIKPLNLINHGITCKLSNNQWSKTKFKILLKCYLQSVSLKFNKIKKRITAEFRSNLESNFIEIALWYGCFHVNLLHIFRTPFLRNASEGFISYSPMENAV